MSSFHDAVSTPEAMDNRGAELLSVAIMLSTARDYYNVVNNMSLPMRPNPEQASDCELTRKEYIEYFLCSELYDAITDISPNFFMKKIKELKDAGNGFPKISAFAPPESESGLRMIRGNGKVHLGRTAVTINGLQSLI